MADKSLGSHRGLLPLSYADFEHRGPRGGETAGLRSRGRSSASTPAVVALHTCEGLLFSWTTIEVKFDAA